MEFDLRGLASIYDDKKMVIFPCENLLKDVCSLNNVNIFTLQQHLQLTRIVNESLLNKEGMNGARSIKLIGNRLKASQVVPDVEIFL